MSFFWKEKKLCWRKLVKQDNFVSLFADLGYKKYFNEPTLKNIELYVCSSFG